MRKILLVTFIIILVTGLILSGCAEPAPAPAAPAPAPAAPAPAPAPAAPAQEPIKWNVSTWMGGGPFWDEFVSLTHSVEKMSGGRLVMTPSLPGALCPIDQQIDAVKTGVAEAMLLNGFYFPGQIPLCYIMPGPSGVAISPAEWRYIVEFWEDGRLDEMFREAYVAYGDIHVVKNVYWLVNSVLCSNVPLYGIEDLKGVKFRSAGFVAETLAACGASTVYVPMDEIYTMLASGAVDACTFAGPADMCYMGINEVTKYWVITHFEVQCMDSLIVKGSTWRALPDDLKAIVEEAVEAANFRMSSTQEIETVEALRFAEDYGVVMIEWSDEDMAAYEMAAKSMWPKHAKSPEVKEALDIVERYMISIGRW